MLERQLRDQQPAGIPHFAFSPRPFLVSILKSERSSLLALLSTKPTEVKQKEEKKEALLYATKARERAVRWRKAPKSFEPRPVNPQKQKKQSKVLCGACEQKIYGPFWQLCITSPPRSTTANARSCDSRSRLDIGAVLAALSARFSRRAENSE